jgi:hypothetical protein
MVAWCPFVRTRPPVHHPLDSRCQLRLLPQQHYQGTTEGCHHLCPIGAHGQQRISQQSHHLHQAQHAVWVPGVGMLQHSSGSPCAAAAAAHVLPAGRTVSTCCVASPCPEVSLEGEGEGHAPEALVAGSWAWPLQPKSCALTTTLLSIAALASNEAAPRLPQAPATHSVLYPTAQVPIEY